MIAGTGRMNPVNRDVGGLSTNRKFRANERLGLLTEPRRRAGLTGLAGAIFGNPEYLSGDALLLKVVLVSVPLTGRRSGSSKLHSPFHLFHGYRRGTCHRA